VQLDLFKTTFADVSTLVRHSRDMRIAKFRIRSSGFLYAVRPLLARRPDRCSRDPNVRKQKYWKAASATLTRQYKEAEIQFQNAIQVDARFADAHTSLLSLPCVSINSNRYQELSKTSKSSPINTRPPDMATS